MLPMEITFRLLSAPWLRYFWGSSELLNYSCRISISRDTYIMA